MTGASPVIAALAKRAKIAAGQTAPSGAHAPAAPDAGLLDCLRRHLLGGETHYPARPGMPELRERVDARLASLGRPARGADSVLITASEGESLFVTLLGLGVFPEGSLIGARGGAHQGLLDWMGIAIGETVPSRPQGGVALYREMRGGDSSNPGGGVDGSGAESPSIVVVGDGLFRDGTLRLDPRDIVVGSFDGLDGMSSFSLGFVAAEPDVVKRITTWKQASSICAPAPPQRAALWAMGVRP